MRGHTAGPTALTLLLVFAAVTAACGETTTPSTAASTTTTVAPTTSTTTSTTSTTTSTTPTSTTSTTTSATTLPPTTTTTVPLPFSTAVHGEMPGPQEGSDGWYGSGCSPGGDAVPDGVWFGFVRSATPWDLTFDLSCVRLAPDPNDDPLEEGFWEMANVNPRNRTIPVDAAAPVTCHWAACPTDPATYAQWVQRATDYLERNPTTALWTEGQTDPTQGLGVWLYVNDGVVTEIVEPVFAG